MRATESAAYAETQTQDLGRKINNRIRRRTGLNGNDEISAVCECVNTDCEGLIRVSVAQYRQLRENSSRFLVLVGHESPGPERIVARGENWLIVQKTGEARRYAEEMDT